MLSLDCKSCHKEADSSIGPAFVLVAKKYAKDPNAVSYLAEKIKKGGAGVWGTTAMAAHPTLAQSDLDQMIGWILSLANKEPVKKSLPQAGSIMPQANQKPMQNWSYLQAILIKVAIILKRSPAAISIALRSNNISFTGREEIKGFTFYSANGNNYLVLPKDEGWFAVDSIDLTNVKSVNIIMGWQNAPKLGFDYEVKLDGSDGKLIGKGSVPTPQKNTKTGIAPVVLDQVKDGNFHKLYFIYKSKDPTAATEAGISMLQFNAK